MSKNNANRYNVSILTAQFDDYLTQKGLSKISRKNYLSDLKIFLLWLNSQKDWLEFNTHTVITYKQFLQNSRLPVRSINRALSAIRAYGDLLVQNQDEFSNPARLVANVPISYQKVSAALINEFSRSNDLSHDDSVALLEFLQLSYDHTKLKSL